MTDEVKAPDDAPAAQAQAPPAAPAAQAAPAPAKQPPAEAPPAEAGQAAAAEQAQPAPVAKPPPRQYVWGTGRRKKSVARVRICSGSGHFLVNKREVDEYFRSERDRKEARAPLETAKMGNTYDVWANVRGGGSTGQADAVKLGLARALVKAVPEVGAALREKGLMTRDARIKERKKYGRHGARRGMQWAKR